MKELSIEEKAKAYDEVIERAKYYYCTTDSAADIKLIGLMFPELKEESEDERIRKALIDYHKRGLKDSPWFTQELKHQEVLAWIEKHGKNNMGISEATKRKLEFNLNKALEKETPESYNEFLDGQGKQKPAWSEEDEKMLEYALDMIEWYGGKDEDKIRLVSDWLKDRIQPKQ